ncbi:hypothetical protein HAX54_039294 [Datura stramonium]|uniref:Secreted protein n=1 Tax=Datura stramonium TaxID=4076 RepID=A0ABS8VL24_DATST|nr:hypothetical protein [Datura stramonium]
MMKKLFTTLLLSTLYKSGKVVSLCESPAFLQCPSAECRSQAGPPAGTLSGKDARVGCPEVAKSVTLPVCFPARAWPLFPICGHFGSSAPFSHCHVAHLSGAGQAGASHAAYRAEGRPCRACHCGMLRRVASSQDEGASRLVMCAQVAVLRGYVILAPNFNLCIIHSNFSSSIHKT